MDHILQENAIASAMNSISANEVDANEVDANEEASELAGAAASEVVTTNEEASELAGAADDAVLDAIVDAVILDDEEPLAVVPAVLETILEEPASVPETIAFKIPEPPANEIAHADEIQAPANEVPAAAPAAPAPAAPAPAAPAPAAPAPAAPAPAPAASPAAQAELPKQTPSQAVLAVAEAVAVFAEACAATAKTVSAAKSAAVATVDAISKASASAPAAPIIKKYRAASYDIHDETYAKELTRIFNDYVDIETQIKFMEKTDELMSEPRISRFCLLGAISDYEKTTDSRKYPFPVIFTDAAYNYRPHQPCVIC